MHRWARGGRPQLPPESDLILRSALLRASRRMGHGPHGSPGDAKHRPETAQGRLLTMREQLQHRQAARLRSARKGPFERRYLGSAERELAGRGVVGGVFRR
jgi:hypothetical protein